MPRTRWPAPRVVCALESQTSSELAARCTARSEGGLGVQAPCAPWAPSVSATDAVVLRLGGQGLPRRVCGLTTQQKLADFASPGGVLEHGMASGCVVLVSQAIDSTLRGVRDIARGRAGATRYYSYLPAARSTPARDLAWRRARVRGVRAPADGRLGGAGERMYIL